MVFANYFTSTNTNMLAAGHERSYNFVDVLLNDQSFNLSGKWTLK